MPVRGGRASSVVSAVWISLFVLASATSAQTLGTFPWQIAPYCNVVRFTVTVEGEAFRLTGFDDQCGAARLPASGTATLRADGSIGFTFFIVTPSGLTSHVAATLSPASISGSWSDSSGASGTLVFNPPLPTSGLHRPAPRLPTAALATNSVTTLQIADAAVGTTELADDAVDGSKLHLPLLASTSTGPEAFRIVNGAGIAIRGDSNFSGGIGVSGNTSVGGIGVAGQANTGTGVAGFTSGGSGVTGIVDGIGIAVRGLGDLGPSAFFESTNAAYTGDVMLIRSFGSADLIEAVQNNQVRFRVTATGAVQGDGAYSSPAADVAEFIDTFDDLAPGDVVEIDPLHAGHFRRTTIASTRAVAGVVTTKPGVLLRSSLERSDVSDGPALALSGRVPVKVCAENGAISPGDLLVASSLAGHAMKAPDMPAPGSVIGKALGVHAAEGVSVIEMLVMLR